MGKCYVSVGKRPVVSKCAASKRNNDTASSREINGPCHGEAATRILNSADKTLLAAADAYTVSILCTAVVAGRLASLRRE